ncbi:hypothetical protein QBC45DRAFT_429539 [Copromyces sp. CBS 386.78]|nr:hypothetical protein QBC45DRAFT_429539 [Copromyces sp. CBS 386.78]
MVALCCLCTLQCDLVPSSSSLPSPFSHSIESIIDEVRLGPPRGSRTRGQPWISRPDLDSQPKIFGETGLFSVELHNVSQLANLEPVLLAWAKLPSQHTTCIYNLMGSLSQPNPSVDGKFDACVHTPTQTLTRTLCTNQHPFERTRPPTLTPSRRPRPRFGCSSSIGCEDKDVLVTALNCFQFDLQLLHLTTTFLSTNHLHCLPRTHLQLRAATKTGRGLHAVVRRACFWALGSEADRKGSHEPVCKFQGMTEMLRILFLFLSAQYVPSSGKSGDSFNALLAAPAAGVHPSSPLQEAKEALIQWTVTLADIPCGGCPTLAIMIGPMGTRSRGRGDQLFDRDGEAHAQRPSSPPLPISLARSVKPVSS